jgi:diaminopimelate decarboxylase
MVAALPIQSNSTLMPSLTVIEEAARRFGTPFYLYDSDILRHQGLSLRSLFDGLASIHFAAFCNTNPDLLSCIREMGLGCMVSSPVELRIAQCAGFSPSNIIVTGAPFGEEELELFTDAKLLINLDSESQLELLASFPAADRAGVRLNVANCVSNGAAPLNSCITSESRVGLFEDALPSFFQKAERLGVIVESLHVYTGTNQLEAATMLRVAERLFQIAARYSSVTTINLGGGFGLPYRSGNGSFPWREFCLELSNLKDRFRNNHKREIDLQIEPGRSLMGPVGFLVSKVVDYKCRGDGQCFVTTDTSLSNFPRPYIYGDKGQHAVTHVALNQGEATSLMATVCGNSVASGDRIAEKVQFTSIPRPGDLIVVHDAGAYGYSMSSQFCGRLRPAELMVENGALYCIRRRESLKSVVDTFGDAAVGLPFDCTTTE